MSFVTVEKLTAGYGSGERQEVIVEDINFTLEKGEIVGLIGLNGSGKSTFVKAFCNLIPHKGEVTIDGDRVEALSRKAVANIIRYIPQQSGISIDISVLDVVLMGFNARLGLLERPGRSEREQALRVLEQVGLGSRSNDNYLLLSEGQKQLVLVARALVSEGKLIVMDEPESALDFRVRYEMMKLVRTWTQTESGAGLVILHDVMLALNTCDRILFLKDKKIASVCDLQKDPMEQMERCLRDIYGDIQLIDTTKGSGRRNLVMIYHSGDE